MGCDDCGNSSPTKECEVHNPVGARICKDCCITKMKGHKCRWWDLCWP
ncbi:MAG: hypothetical protein QXN71_02075 [Candidatus Aenigmatarchaeota archaeon]